ncbi:MAG: hypothetical protein EXX96DRAFT_91808 [Benjaminiella poitrasii]|nr:MAG: hypothetical protein EXX96DRAFT_91808 [Benjaminiella poitrasii]
MTKSENELQAEISDKIDSTWEEMKHIQIKEEDQFDDFWNEDVIPQLPNETTPIKNDKKDHVLVSKAPLEVTIVQEDLSNSSQMNMSSISSLSSEEDMFDDKLNRQDVTASNDVNMSSTKDSDESNLNEKRLRDASLLDDTASKKAKYDNTPNILNANISGDVDQKQLVSTNTEEKMQSQEDIGDLLEMTSSSEAQGNDFMYATQSEEELDLDFVNNVQSYF